MKLHVEQIRNITRGAVRVTEEKDGIHFYRFTEAQEALYKNVRTEFYPKTQATAGIRLEFQTDSKELEIKANIISGSSRTYFSLDVFVNGELNGYLDNFSHKELPEDYITAIYETGRFSKVFSLGEGEKTVCIYFPWSAKTVIEEIVLDDGAYVKPTKEKKKLLVYGDSITQGYDALRPSHRYPARIADAFNMEEINKAIGGEIHCPELAKEREDFNPDYIMVAYGTNDWSKCSKETVKQNCEGFYKALCNHYPDTPILTIAPIWRKDFCDFREFGLFHEVEELIRETVKSYKNIRVISGYGFVPADENYFSDKYLHPNDAGFEHYFHGLYKEIENMKNKTAVLTALQTIEIQETPMPVIGADDVMVKMEYCGVCGSDVEFFAHGCIGTNKVTYPFILGHEVAGVIAEVGENVKNVKVGQSVVIEPGIPCGHCEHCRQGRYNICANMKFMSSSPYEGLLSQYVSVPASTVFPVPEGVSTKTAALVEPLAVGMHAARLGDVKAPKTVVILGGGCIGLCTLLCAKYLGASRIIVSDLFQNRLDAAKALGADEIVNASECNSVEKILELTNGEGADVVLETAGSKITASQTTKILRRGGTIVIVGNVLGDVPFNFRDISRIEGTVKVARRYCNDFQACLGAIQNGGIPAEKLERIVDAVYPFAETQKAFETSITDKQNITKVVIKVSED